MARDISPVSTFKDTGSMFPTLSALWQILCLLGRLISGKPFED